MNEYLFEYHFGGSTWGITIRAKSALEACEKIKVVGLARYKGEVGATIPVPGGGLIVRLLTWLKS